MLEKETQTNQEEVASEVVDNPTPEKKDDFVIPLPESEKEKDKKILEPNSKPFWTMRLAGGFIDACILFLAVIGLNQLFMLTPMGKTINKYQDDMIYIQDEYKLKALVEGSEETFAHKVHENDENYTTYQGYLVHDEDETGYKFIVVNNDEISKEVKTAYNNAIKNDVTYSNLNFDWKLMSYGMTMLSGFIAEGVFLLAVPLLNKRRQTLGKLAAGTQLVDAKFQTPPRWYQVVGRFAWQYLIESALPYLLITNMLLMILIVPAVLFVIVLFNKKGRTLHDFVSRTMVIDKRTYLPINEQ